MHHSLMSGSLRRRKGSLTSQSITIDRAVHDGQAVGEELPVDYLRQHFCRL